MAFVYLIGLRGVKDKFKIGMTKQKSIQSRLNELQTGNQEELYIHDSFESKFPSKVEAMLHKKYAYKRLLNEWFALNEEDVANFQKDCQMYEKGLLLASSISFKKLDFQF